MVIDGYWWLLRVFKIWHKFREPIRFRKTIPLQTAIPHAQHRSVNRSLLHILQLRIKAILRNSLEHQPGPEEMRVGTKKVLKIECFTTQLAYYH